MGSVALGVWHYSAHQLLRYHSQRSLYKQCCTNNCDRVDCYTIIILLAECWLDMRGANYNVAIYCLSLCDWLLITNQLLLAIATKSLIFNASLCGIGVKVANRQLPIMCLSVVPSETLILISYTLNSYIGWWSTSVQLKEKTPDTIVCYYGNKSDTITHSVLVTQVLLWLVSGHSTEMQLGYHKMRTGIQFIAM